MISVIPNGAVLPLQRELRDLRGLAAARLAADDDDAVRRDDLGFGRIVASELEAPNMLANLV